MNQEVLTLTPGGQALAQSLGFRAASVIVDNLTSSYLRLTDVGKTLPPWVYGAVVALPPGLTRASAKLTATVPAIPGPPVPNSEATLTWTDQVLAADPGHLLQQSNFSQSVPLVVSAGDSGIYTTQPNTVLTKVVYPIPAGALSVRWVINQGGPAATWTGAKVVGNVTGVQYNTGTSDSGVAGGFDEEWALHPEDTSLLWSIDTTGSANPVSYWFTANIGTGFVGVRVFSGPGTVAGLPLFVRNDNPAAWQAPGLSPVSINLTLAGGASQVVLAAAGGKTVYLFALNRTYDAAVVTEFAVQDTAGTNYHIEQAAAVNPGPVLWAGAPLPAGLGVQVKNLGANSATMRGSLAVSQA